MPSPPGKHLFSRSPQDESHIFLSQRQVVSACQKGLERGTLFPNSPGTLQSSKTSSHVFEPRMPSLSSFLAVLKPGIPFAGIEGGSDYVADLHHPLQTAPPGRDHEIPSALMLVFGHRAPALRLRFNSGRVSPSTKPPLQLACSPHFSEEMPRTFCPF